MKIVRRTLLLSALCLSMIGSASAENLNDRLSVTLDQTGRATVKNSYLTNYLLRGVNPKTNETGPLRVIKRSPEAIDFGSILTLEYDGIYPSVDIATPQFSVADTIIELSDYNYPNSIDWRNSDLSFTGASIVGLASNRPSNSEELTDAISLILLNSLAFADVTAEVLIGVSEIDHGTVFDIVKPLAESIQDYETYLRSSEDVFLICSAYLGLLDAFIAEGVFSLDEYPQAQSAYNYVSSFVQAVNELGIFERINETEIDARKGTIADQYRDLVNANIDDTTDVVFSKVIDKFTEEIQTSGTGIERKALVASYFVNPFAKTLKAYQNQLEADLLEEELKAVKSEIKIDSLKKKISVARNGIAIAKISNLLFNTEDLIEVAKNEPELILDAVFETTKMVGSELISINKEEIIAKYGLQSITKADGRGVAYGNIRQAADNAKPIMKAFDLGTNIGNKMIPLIWDFVLGENHLATSIVDGEITSFGKAETFIRAEKNGTFVGNYSNETNSLIHYISADQGDTVSFKSSFHRPLLFSPERSPWELNTRFAPRTLYSIGVVKPNSYDERRLCIRKLLGNLDLAVHNVQAGSLSDAINENPSPCGVGTLFGDDAFKSIIGSQTVYNDPDDLPLQYKVQTAPEDISTYIHTVNHTVEGTEGEQINVNFNGFQLNNILHQFKIVPATTELSFDIDTSVLAQDNLTISAILPDGLDENPDVITNITYDWGDGTSNSGTSLTPLSHTYSEAGLYTVTVTITRSSGQIATHSVLVDVLSPTPPLASPQNVATVSNDQSITISWDEVDEADSYNIYYAKESFGTPPNLENYASFQGGTIVQAISATSYTVDVSDNNQSYYFLVVAVNQDQTSVPSDEVEIFIGENFETPIVNDDFAYGFGELDRVSVNSDGEPANDDSIEPSVSSDGRFTVFLSRATNLAPDDNDFHPPVAAPLHVFLHDNTTGITELISKDVDGKPVEALKPSISLDGRFVTYRSDANNVIETTDNNTSDIYIYDREKGKVINIPLLPNVLFYERAVVSGSGRYVALSSVVSGSDDAIYIVDRQENTFKIIDAPFSATNPVSISADGEHIAFKGANEQIFLYSASDDTVKLVSKNTDGVAGNEPSFNPQISANATHIIFTSEASNLSSDDSNGFRDIYRYDIVADEVEFISSWSESGMFLDYSKPTISANGRHISFVLTSNSVNNIFAFDIKEGGEPVLISGMDAETPLPRVFPYIPVISADGQAVSFVHDNEIFVSRRSGEFSGLSKVLEDDFNDGILDQSQNWTYNSTHGSHLGDSVSESNGYLNIRNDSTNNGGQVEYRFSEPITDANIFMRRLYHASEGRPFFGATILEFEGADNQRYFFRTDMLRSNHSPDYLNNSDNYNHPRYFFSNEVIEYIDGSWQLVFPTEEERFRVTNFVRTVNTSELLDEFLDITISHDSKSGTITLDLTGDGQTDAEFLDEHLVGATLRMIKIHGYGWFTGHYTQIDKIRVDGVVE